MSYPTRGKKKKKKEQTNTLATGSKGNPVTDWETFPPYYTVREVSTRHTREMYMHTSKTVRVHNTYVQRYIHSFLVLTSS